jgi:hypothetical protein
MTLLIYVLEVVGQCRGSLIDGLATYHFTVIVIIPFKLVKFTRCKVFIKKMRINAYMDKHPPLFFRNKWMLIRQHSRSMSAATTCDYKSGLILVGNKMQT